MMLCFSALISRTKNNAICALSSWTVPIVSAPVVEHQHYMDWTLTWFSLSCRSLRRSWLCCSSRLKEHFSSSAFSYFSLKPDSSSWISTYWKQQQQKKERERESRNLSEEAMSLVNNTHCVCPGASRSFFRSRALFCDMPANESQLYFLSLSNRMGITSFCSSLILLLLCSSWLVALWCSSCRTLSWFSRSVCVFSRVLTVLLRLVFCFLELWAGCRFRLEITS